MFQKARIAAILGVTTLFALACGGGGSQYGSVELQTYQSGGSRLVFNMGGRVKTTWKNMAGDAVVGEWTQSGEEVEIIWPEADNYGGKISRFKQTGPCSLTRYYGEAMDGTVYDDPLVYQRTKPSCDTVQVR